MLGVRTKASTGSDSSVSSCIFPILNSALLIQRRLELCILQCRWSLRIALRNPYFKKLFLLASKFGLGTCTTVL